MRSEQCLAPVLTSPLFSRAAMVLGTERIVNKYPCLNAFRLLHLRVHLCSGRSGPLMKPCTMTKLDRMGGRCDAGVDNGRFVCVWPAGSQQSHAMHQQRSDQVRVAGSNRFGDAPQRAALAFLESQPDSRALAQSCVSSVTLIHFGPHLCLSDCVWRVRLVLRIMLLSGARLKANGGKKP